MKIILLVVVAAIALIVGGFFYLGQKSKAGDARGVVGGALAPCPDKPNCVRSESGTGDHHAIAPLPLAAWDRLPAAVSSLGGEIVAETDDYIAATFTSSVFGFVDDVEFRKGAEVAHVRSASRVGRSDLGANRKRIEALRAALAG
ncbi:MAG: DUF1499 domain-containing protein [Pseudomonadota bacterium]